MIVAISYVDDNNVNRCTFEMPSCNILSFRRAIFSLSNSISLIKIQIVLHVRIQIVNNVFFLNMQSCRYLIGYISIIYYISKMIKSISNICFSTSDSLVKQIVLKWRIMITYVLCNQSQKSP